MPNSELSRIVYSSFVSRRFTESELWGLLTKSRAKNERLNITGILFFDGERFLQVLEGPINIVRRLYAAIERDPSHREVTTLIVEPIPKRTFYTWRMAYHGPASSDVLYRFGYLEIFNAPTLEKQTAAAIKMLREYRTEHVPSTQEKAALTL